MSHEIEILIIANQIPTQLGKRIIIPPDHKYKMCSLGLFEWVVHKVCPQYEYYGLKWVKGQSTDSGRRRWGGKAYTIKTFLQLSAKYFAVYFLLLPV